MDIKITLDVTDRLLEVLERLSRFGQVNYPDIANTATAASQVDLTANEESPAAGAIECNIRHYREAEPGNVREVFTRFSATSIAELQKKVDEVLMERGALGQADIEPHVAKLREDVKAIAEVTETPLRTEPEAVEERDQRVKDGMFAAVKEFSPKPADVTHLPEAPVKRRRTKAQIEEDKENGLDDRFKQLSKEMPDASVDQIRDKMYAEVAAANVAAPDAEEADSSPSPDEPGGDDDWVPNWT